MRRSDVDAAEQAMGHWQGLPVAQACIAILALLVCVYVLGCASAPGPRGTARSTPLPVPTATPIACPPAAAPTSAVQQQLATAVARAAGQDAHCLDVVYRAQDRTAEISITVPWPIADTDHDIAATQEQAKALSFRAQQALWTSGIPLSGATVIVLGPILDSEAFVTAAAYSSVTLQAPTAAKLSWASLSADVAWGEYDKVYLRPNYDDVDNVVRH